MAIYSMEIQDQLNYFALKISSQMLHCVLYFEECLDERLMMQAVRLSLKMEPILGCHLIFKNKQPFWESREDMDQLEFCEVIKTQNVQKDLEQFLINNVDAERDPLVQVKIFRGLKTGDCLCIKMNHVACDAGGLKDYVSLIARLYTTLVDGIEPQLHKLEVVERGQNQLINTLSTQLRATLEEKSKNFMQSNLPNWSFPSQGYHTTHPAFVLERINGNQFIKMKNMAKQYKVTINDLLLTAFCLALKKEGNHPSDRPMIIQVPVDLRRYLSDKKALVCNLTGAEYIKVIVKDDEGFLDVLHKVREAMKLIKVNYPGLTSAFALNALSQLDFTQAKTLMQSGMEKSIQYNVSIPLLTNMGIIPDDNKKYGNLTAVDGYLVSPMMYSPGLMVGVSSFDDTLTLTVGFYEDSVERDTMEKLLRGIRMELKKVSYS